MKGSSGKKIYLGNKPNGYGPSFETMYFDSAISINDRTKFTGVFAEKNWYSIEVEGTEEWQTFIIDTGIIYVRGSVDSIYKSTISGSSEDSLLTFFYRFIQPLFGQQKKFKDSANQLRQLGDTLRSNMLKDSSDKYQTRFRKEFFDFIYAHSEYFASLYLANRYYTYDFINTEKESYLHYLSLLPSSLKDNSIAQVLRFKLTSNYVIQEGEQWKDIPLYNIKNQEQILSNLLSKLTVIDFWASWCKPCLEQMPDLKKLESQYKNKGLSIVGVSLDTNKEAWLKAIQKYHLTWTNLSDLKGMEAGGIGLLYNVQAIPYKLIVDNKGIIVKVNPTEEEIAKFVSDFLL